MMREHRLIERMIAAMRRELERIDDSGETDPVFVESAVDFFRTYGDRTHHGKEEEIYFRDLANKDLEPGLRKTMEELIEEHVYARGKVRALREANERYASGERDALGEITSLLADLVEFYPVHIEKEDKRFFFPTQEYFSREEQALMLAEFERFDAQMIHSKYMEVVSRYEEL
jgi:hemerythrin-like domain-containing protein